MKPTMNFSALFGHLRDLAAEHQARAASIADTWRDWHDAAMNAGGTVETTPPERIAHAAHVSDQKHAAARLQVFRTHEPAIRAELASRLEALRPVYESLVTQMEALDQFEQDAYRFTAQCGAPTLPRLADPTITSVQLAQWASRIERVLRPAPAPRRPTPVDVDAILDGVAS